MKNWIIGGVVALLLIAAFGTAGFFVGQATAPATGLFRTGMMNWRYDDRNYDGGYGMMGQRGGMMGYRGYDRGDTLMHETMTDALASKLGLSSDELDSRLSKGETLSQIAESKGYTGEKYTTLLTEARDQALDQAVKDGELSQEQADWMKQRGWMMGRGEFEAFDCPCLDSDGA